MSLAWIEATMSSIEVPPRSQRPIDPANSVSPVSSVAGASLGAGYREADASRRVTGRVENVETHVSGAQDVAVAQVAVERHHGGACARPIHPACIASVRYSGKSAG